MASSLYILAALVVVALAPLSHQSAAVLEEGAEVESHEIAKRQTFGYCSYAPNSLVSSVCTGYTYAFYRYNWPVGTYYYSYSSGLGVAFPTTPMCYNCTTSSFATCTTSNLYSVSATCYYGNIVRRYYSCCALCAIC